jgi:long-chain acyl-CoA synthetase
VGPAISFESKTMTGPWFKHVEAHPDKTYIISRFTEKGVKTPDNLHEISYVEANRTILDFAKGLWEMGFKEYEKLAVFAPNRPRWLFACQAAIASRGVHVPIYPTSKQDDVWWILSDSEVKFVVCGSMEHAEKALKAKPELDILEKIILMDPLPKDHDDFIISFDEVVEMGKNSSISDDDINKRAEETEEEDMAATIYTSGTTGRPKGVELTHKNLVAQRLLENDFDFEENEVFLAHLPMCHSFGFSSDFLSANNIGATLFVADSLETMEMRKNLADCRPTFMASVPRLWEKFYITIGQTIDTQSPLKKKMISWSIGVGTQAFKLRSEGKPVPGLLQFQANIAAKLLNKVLSKVGLDRLKYSATGGGPINAKLIDFFGGMGINLYQGFGLTETAPIIIANTPKNNRVGTVGKPLSNVEVKIADDGEILIKAPQVMRGYHNNPEASKEVLLEGGWFATGDIGEIDPDGFVKITDRKKELIITSGGKNIAPQPIENEFNTDAYIETAVAIGDNRKFISALVVPEFENVKNWLSEQHGETIDDNQKLIDHPKVKELLEERVAIANENLAKYEKIKKFVVIPNSFTEETGELTPSQKKKRRVINEKYNDQIEGMYPKD